MFIVEMKDSLISLAELKICNDINSAAETAHEFFTNQGYELREGRPFDPACALDGADETAYNVFSNVKILNDNVISFTHCDGDGPCCRIVRAK